MQRSELSQSPFGFLLKLSCSWIEHRSCRSEGGSGREASPERGPGDPRQDRLGWRLAAGQNRLGVRGVAIRDPRREKRARLCGRKRRAARVAGERIEREPTEPVRCEREI